MRTYAARRCTFVRGEGTLPRSTPRASGTSTSSPGSRSPRSGTPTRGRRRHRRPGATLSHVSNLYDNDVSPEVATTLDRLIGGGTRRAGGQVFFANSGAEANECAIKLARRFGRSRAATSSSRA